MNSAWSTKIYIDKRSEVYVNFGVPGTDSFSQVRIANTSKVSKTTVSYSRKTIFQFNALLARGKNEQCPVH